MSKPTLHLVGIFHTIHDLSYSHCAFTGKALRFSKMMQQRGYHVVEYANEGSESEAREKIVILKRDELNKLIGPRNKTDFYADLASIGSPQHVAFETRLVQEMKKRVQPRDIICHPFGHAHSRLLQDFPEHIHVETGIGYPTLVDGTIRIFESYAWRHYHAGKDNRSGSNYEWVIPNYFDLEDWQPGFAPGKYYAFLGRIGEHKGLNTILEIARHLPENSPKIILCGQGDPTPWTHPKIEYRGPIEGRERSEFMRNAICSLMPTVFIEPFGGSGVEGLLCGTPLIATDYGAFTETVQHGFNGFRCKTLADWLDALEAVESLDRYAISAAARDRYSLEACSKMYDDAFTKIHQLYDRGWYTLPEKRLKRGVKSAQTATA